MAGVLHSIDQRRLIDSDGIADGATLTFYLTGTSTLAPIYYDFALTDPAPNPMTVAAGAAVPNIYLNDDITYRRVITYSDGETDDADPYSAPWATRAELENISSGGGIALEYTSSSSAGVITKGGHRFIHDYPGVIGQNTFMGVRAGNFTTPSTTSTGFGFEVLRDLTTGELNAGFASRALQRVTTGAVNSAFGVDALASLTTGTYNNAFGCKALANATTGSNNNAFGQSCLWGNTGDFTGSGNCGFGQDTMIAVTTANSNCGFGNQSLSTITSASNNAAFGTQSLRSNTANNNSAFGYRSAFSNTTGTSNVSVGYEAGYDNLTGNDLTLVGFIAGRGNVSGSGLTAVGMRAGYGVGGDDRSTVDENVTFIGAYAARNPSVPTATPIVNSTAIGYYSSVDKSNQVVLGNSLVTETVLRGVQKATVFSVATLPAGSVGMRAFVSDCNTTTFAAAAAGGGSNAVPVYHDGTSWKVG